MNCRAFIAVNEAVIFRQAVSKLRRFVKNRRIQILSAECFINMRLQAADKDFYFAQEVPLKLYPLPP